MRLKYHYFSVVEVPSERGTEKPSYDIINNRSCQQIGIIGWYAPWRKWCFSPCGTTIWSEDCLKAVQDAIKNIKEAGK